MEITDKRRAFLILLALFTGGAVPIQLVTLSFGYSQYYQEIAMGPKMIMGAHEFAKLYIPLVYIPALLILVGLILYSRRNYPDLFRRIVIGMGAGMLATVALDYFREMGVINGWLPGDTPAMFGKAATGSRSFAVYYPVGYMVHFLNGANFGLIFSGFMAMDIPEDQIRPRENVFTWGAWKAKGRQPRRDERDNFVTVNTWRPVFGDVQQRDGSTRKGKTGMVPTTARVYHESQTEPMAA